MRRVVLALIMAFAMVGGTAQAALACACTKVVEPKPCAGVRACDWGGDPDAIWVEVKAPSKKAAQARAKRVVANMKSEKVKPRSLDVVAYAGKKRVTNKTYKLAGKHWVYDAKEDCWTVK